MKRLLLMAAVAVLVPLHRGTAAPDPTETITDDQFVTRAAVGGSTEVESGKMALRNSQTAEVKSFAQRMIDDHTKANQQLLTIAGRKQIRVPKILDAKHQHALDRLGRLQGSEFDKAYAEQMLKDHKETVALFEAEARDGKDAELKGFATETLPILKEHLKLAQALAGRFGAGVKSADKR